MLWSDLARLFRRSAGQFKRWYRKRFELVGRFVDSNDLVQVHLVKRLRDVRRWPIDLQLLDLVCGTEPDGLAKWVGTERCSTIDVFVNRT